MITTCYKVFQNLPHVPDQMCSITLARGVVDPSRWCLPRTYQEGEWTAPDPHAARLGYKLLCFDTLEHAKVFAADMIDVLVYECQAKNLHKPEAPRLEGDLLDALERAAHNKDLVVSLFWRRIQLWSRLNQPFSCFYPLTWPPGTRMADAVKPVRLVR